MDNKLMSYFVFCNDYTFLQLFHFSLGLPNFDILYNKKAIKPLEHSDTNILTISA